MPDSSTADAGVCPVSIRNYQDIVPWDHYETLRAGGPLVWDEQIGAWIVLGFQECHHVEVHEDRFRNPYQDAPPVVVQIKGGGRNITLLGGDEHKRMRRFFLKLMTQALVEGYRRQQIAPVIELVMGRILAKGCGRAELCRDFGDQIPARVIAALLGMSWQDDALIARIGHLHEAIMEVIGSGFASEEIRARGLALSQEINDLLLPSVRKRRAEPGDDFISRVWSEAPTEFGLDLTEADVVAICRELFLGGADTTVHGIANVLYLVLTDAAVRSAVVANPETAIPAAVEEAMRLYGSVMYRFRVANQDCELGGVAVKQDQRLILLHSAANRDPAKFACPNDADLTRRPITEHLAFNKGPRTCVGIGLARAEMCDALSAVLKHLPNVRLDPAAEQPCFASLFMRSWRPLNVVFD